MDGSRLINGHQHNPFVGDQDESIGGPPEKLVGSRIQSGKMTETVSPRKGRRAVQKRVVTIPIVDADGSRAKCEATPPPDSWAWRKYGQKPIKGSPYPRGYYRCSSSKGCPARKQVERSRADPSMLVITYACEHNHPWPVSRGSSGSKAAQAAHVAKTSSEEPAIFSGSPGIESDDKFPDMEGDSALIADEFGWFSEVASSPTVDSVLHSPICAGVDDDVDAMVFTMREEDESLFADLGELPECSVVFRSRFCDQDDSRACSLRPASVCGSTG